MIVLQTASKVYNGVCLARPRSQQSLIQLKRLPLGESPRPILDAAVSRMETIVLLEAFRYRNGGWKIHGLGLPRPLPADPRGAFSPGLGRDPLQLPVCVVRSDQANAVRG